MFGAKTVQEKWLLRYGRLIKNGIWIIAKRFDTNRRRRLTIVKEYIERGALIARYDAEHVGPPGRARELMATAPAADVVPAVEFEDLRAKYQALVAEKDKNSGDTAETYTTGYRYGHRNGQIELLQQILNI